MTVADALATVRKRGLARSTTFLGQPHDWRGHYLISEEELARVEAEIVRLERENAQVLHNIKDEAVQTIQAKEYGSEQFRRAEAAEAEIARLRDGLRGPLREALVEAGTEIASHGDHPERIDIALVYREVEKAIAVARALPAEGGAA